MIISIFINSHTKNSSLYFEVSINKFENYLVKYRVLVCVYMCEYASVGTYT